MNLCVCDNEKRERGVDVGVNTCETLYVVGLTEAPTRVGIVCLLLIDKGKVK